MISVTADPWRGCEACPGHAKTPEFSVPNQDPAVRRSPERDRDDGRRSRQESQASPLFSLTVLEYERVPPTRSDRQNARF